MEVSIGLFSIFCMTLVSLAAIGSSGGNSKIADKAIKALEFTVDVIFGKLNRK